MRLKNIKLASLLLFILFILYADIACASPKREFRGAWIQCVNEQFIGLSTEQMQQTLTEQLNELKKDGVNAIIFQVRAECDALYPSKIEPWSRFLTGQQGVAPSPYWDPLAWMIEQCHKRGMELHAWINPFRAKTKTTNQLAPNHIAQIHPERVFNYNGLYILNPGIEANREYICRVAADIVRRYDIDGLHIDDYFYPYPEPGWKINDEVQYAASNNGINNIGDWRRDNVNVFIKQLSDTIHKIKPWVKFGVSPFGIYRNAKNAPGIGSRTNGLQNYDDLYADVLLWVNNGWVDYCAPQLYWEIGHKAADYKTLITWWNKYASARPIFIGEDVIRTTKYPDPANSRRNQMLAKFKLHEQMKNVSGTVLWYAKAVADNVGNYGHALRSIYWRSPALQPLMPWLGNDKPRKPSKVEVVWTSDGPILFWQAPREEHGADSVRQYVVYKFGPKDKVDIDNSSKIVAITNNTMLRLRYKDGKRKYTYCITSLDRLQNESKPVKKKVKL